MSATRKCRVVAVSESSGHIHHIQDGLVDVLFTELGRVKERLLQLRCRASSRRHLKELTASTILLGAPTVFPAGTCSPTASVKICSPERSDMPPLLFPSSVNMRRPMVFCFILSVVPSPAVQSSSEVDTIRKGSLEVISSHMVVLMLAIITIPPTT